MNIINLDDPNGFGLGLEREDTFDSFVKQKKFIDRFLWRTAAFLVNAIGYMPYVYFEREDVDEKVVEKLMRHPDLLKSVSEWIENTNQEMLPHLVEAKKVFERYQKPKRRDSKLYRGFKASSGQQTHGLGRMDIWKMPIGTKFEDTPTKLVSFSAYEEVTKAYGNVKVSVDYAKEDHRMFHITNEVMIAFCMLEDEQETVDAFFESLGPKRLFCYFESVFLPDGKPLEFTLLKK